MTFLRKLSPNSQPSDPTPTETCSSQAGSPPKAPPMTRFRGWKRSNAPNINVTLPNSNVKGGIRDISEQAQVTVLPWRKQPRCGRIALTYAWKSFGGMTITVVPVSTRKRRGDLSCTPTDPLMYHNPLSLLGTHVNVNGEISGLCSAPSPIRSSACIPLLVCTGMNTKSGATPMSLSLVKNGAPRTEYSVLAKPRMPSQTCSGGANISFSTTRSRCLSRSKPAKCKVSVAALPSTRPVPKYMSRTAVSDVDLTRRARNC
mmetsp:Transcript_99006/g.288723  ORF Transcript_99006/g.288723 Transcript_99006/m.288723 type:complete len:259 (-) Transcript_99006:905-1681(-)